LIEIARDIRWLESDLGGLEAVSKTVDVSTDQLRQFLSVERLCPEVQKLVGERKIDLINTVHYMRSFDAEAQQVIAKEVVEGRLSAEDIRTLAPLHRRFLDLSIDQLIARVQKSRNIRVYIAYFRLPHGFMGANALQKRFEEVVGQAEIVSFTVEGQIGTLKLTSFGRKRLQEAAKERKMSLRKFVDTLVLEQHKRGTIVE
jgi:hypothetical protein